MNSQRFLGSIYKISGESGTNKLEPTKKCAGVIALNSSGSLDFGAIGLEFRHASI